MPTCLVLRKNRNIMQFSVSFVKMKVKVKLYKRLHKMLNYNKCKNYCNLKLFALHKNMIKVYYNFSQYIYLFLNRKLVFILDRLSYIIASPVNKTNMAASVSRSLLKLRFQSVSTVYVRPMLQLRRL